MALVPDDELTCRTTFQKSVAILKPIPSRIESVFLYYALQANARRLIEFAGGTAQKNLLLRDLRAFEVCIPPISLQRRIASILGAYDDLIEVNRRRIAVLEEMARRLFDEWFVHFRFPGHEDRAMADRLPEAWTMRRLGDFLTLQRGHDLPSNVRVEGSVPVVSSSGISGLHNEKRADGPGIVTGRYGTLGDVYFIDGPYWPLNTALYVKDFKGNPPIFLFHMLEKTIASVKSNTSAVPGINRNVLHALAVPGSPIALRNRFEIFAAMNYRQISVIRRAVSNLQQARDLLLPRLISGDLSVATAERELEAAE
jgi:type I restriction enzyme S subunit